MKKEFFKKVYVFDTLKSEDDFLMCGDINWDFYFLQNRECLDCDVLENVIFYELENTDISIFEKLIKDKNFIDCEQEEHKSYILSYA